jgi:hypothetical protein
VAKRVPIARSAKTLKHLVARIANMEGKVIDVGAGVADREKFASRHKPLDFLVMWDSVHKTADMPIKMKSVSVPEPFTGP